jgi:hypothetical protein
MGISSLPTTFEEWRSSHNIRLNQDLIKSDLTIDLYKQYKKHLGKWRYWALLKVQSSIAPQKVLDLLSLKPSSALAVAISGYKFCKKLQLDSLLKALLLPKQYQQQIKQLNGYQSEPCKHY